MMVGMTAMATMRATMWAKLAQKFRSPSSRT